MESKKANNLRVIIGLGNPGKEYKDTFHNAGFKFLDFLSGEEAAWRSGPSFSYFKYGPFALVKTDSFLMNESGKAAKKAISYFKSTPAETAFVHDDADIPLGEYRIQFGRGPAGHRGVSSAIAEMKTRDFWRVRIGIRNEGERRRKKAGDFVLRTIDARSLQKLTEVFQSIKAELGI